MNTLITICARGGSKGIPKKNIKILNGKPLIAYTIEFAKNLQLLFNNTFIALSTDSNEIKIISNNYQIFTEYERPSNLATDTAGKIETINDILLYHENLNNITFDFIFDFDVTSPLRTINDVLNAYNILREDPEALNIFSVSDAVKNPYFNMVEKNEKGYFNLVKNSGNFKSRQKSPIVYELNASFYIYRRTFFSQNLTSAITDKSLVYKMPHICFDLDHLIDFDFLEYLMSQNKLDFL